MTVRTWVQPIYFSKEDPFFINSDIEMKETYTSVGLRNTASMVPCDTHVSKSTDCEWFSKGQVLRAIEE